MVKTKDAIALARSLIGTPYAELDCINLIKKVIRDAPGGVKTYTTAGTNALWDSYDMSAKYRDLTWRQEGLDGAQAGMLAFKADGEDVHHVGLVTDGGTVRVKRASRMATSGMSMSSFRGILTLFCLSVTTEMEVTSEPVPLVVGIAASTGRGISSTALHAK